MELYGLTRLGVRLARSTGSPDTPEWRVIYFLDKRRRATKEQMLAFCDVSSGELSAVLRRLRAKHIIGEETGVSV